MQVVSNKLHDDDAVAEWSALQAKAIMELEDYLRTMHNKFFQQKDVIAMVSSPL
jgi:hypothetical protein